MMNTQSDFTFSFNQNMAMQATATVTVSKPFIDSIYMEALVCHRARTRTPGFALGSAPLAYIEQNYKTPIISHLKNFFFAYYVIDFLLQKLALLKIAIIGEPRLIATSLEPQQAGVFSFALVTPPITINPGWNNLSFRAPRRKNYQDLDKQVKTFITEEQERTTAEQHNAHRVEINDWVCFSLTPLQTDSHPLFNNHANILWIKIGDEEADLEAQTLFLGKKTGDTFTTQATFLQDYVHNTFDSPYTFVICVIAYASNHHFSLDAFKKHFSLKSAKDIHLKFIEIFSYRRDISQRRETVEAVLKLLVNNHPFTIPDQLIQTHKKRVFEIIHLNPDYYVYKAQPDFQDKINLLAEKQLKEMAIVDSLAYTEGITIDNDDILSYLNLLKRPRTREFVYFDLPSTKIQGRETPLSHDIIRQHCLREKTINYVIQSLTKNKNNG